MRYIFGGRAKLLYSHFPPYLPRGEKWLYGKIYYIAIFLPIQVRGENIAIFPGGKWLYNTGCLILRPFFYPSSLTFGDGQIR